jgi:hypothetical protein
MTEEEVEHDQKIAMMMTMMLTLLLLLLILRLKLMMPNMMVMKAYLRKGMQALLHTGTATNTWWTRTKMNVCMNDQLR